MNLLYLLRKSGYKFTLGLRKSYQVYSLVRLLCIDDSKRCLTSGTIGHRVESKLDLRQSSVPLLGFVNNHTSKHVAKSMINYLSLTFSLGVMEIDVLNFILKTPPQLLPEVIHEPDVPVTGD